MWYFTFYQPTNRSPRKFHIPASFQFINYLVIEQDKYYTLDLDMYIIIWRISTIIINKNICFWVKHVLVKFNHMDTYYN